MGDLLDSNQWKELEDLEGFSDLPTRHRIALSINFNRVKAFCRLRFRGALETIGPEPWPRTFNYIRASDKKAVKLDTVSDRRALQWNITAAFFNVKGTLPGHWSDDEVGWGHISHFPTLGMDAEVAWCFAKNRLADPIFLFHARKMPSRLCPWCRVEGSAWHMVVECRQAAAMWRLVHAILKKLLGDRQVLLRDIFTCFKPRNNSDAPTLAIANFILTLAKSTVYRVITTVFKDLRHPAAYDAVLKARIKARILKEYAWHLGRGDLNSFSAIWGTKEAICKTGPEGLVFMI